MTSVGFVGLGNIGKPMALRIASVAQDRDLELWVHDLAAGPVADLVAAGAHASPSVPDLAPRVQVLCVMVRDDDQVRDVLDQALETAREGLTVVVHSTVGPDTPAALEELAAGRGVRVLDAPVSGGAMGAGDGRLAIMVGGSEEAVSSARPVLDVLGAKIVHAGAIGAGTRMKLARNLMHFVAYAAATEAQRLAEASGLDLKVLGEVVRYTDAITGGAGAIMHRGTTGPLSVDDVWRGVFEPLRTLAEKDLSQAIELADQLGVEVPLAQLALAELPAGLGLAP